MCRLSECVILNILLGVCYTGLMVLEFVSTAPRGPERAVVILGNMTKCTWVSSENCFEVCVGLTVVKISKFTLHPVCASCNVAVAVLVELIVFLYVHSTEAAYVRRCKLSFMLLLAFFNSLLCSFLQLIDGWFRLGRVQMLLVSMLFWARRVLYELNWALILAFNTVITMTETS